MQENLNTGTIDCEDRWRKYWIWRGFWKVYWFVGSYDAYPYIVYYYDDSFSGLFLKSIASIINSELDSKIVQHSIISNQSTIPIILTWGRR